MIENGELDSVEVSESLSTRIERHKSVTSQLVKDHGLKRTDGDHFRNYASYVLKQGALSEQDGLIRGLNISIFVKDRQIILGIDT